MNLIPYIDRFDHTDDSLDNKVKSLSTGNIARRSSEDRTLMKNDKISVKDQYLTNSRYITGQSSKKCMSNFMNYHY